MPNGPCDKLHICYSESTQVLIVAVAESVGNSLQSFSSSSSLVIGTLLFSLAHWCPNYYFSPNRTLLLEFYSDFLFLLELVSVVCVFPGTFPIHLGYLICWIQLPTEFPVLFIYVRSVVMSSLLFLILVIWVFFFSQSS